MGTGHQTFATRWDAIWDRLWPDDHKMTSRQTGLLLAAGVVGALLFSWLGWYFLALMSGLLVGLRLRRRPAPFPWYVRVTAGLVTTATACLVVYLISS
jgi:hypothetical protein